MKTISEQLKHSEESETMHLLWTGGWDSTFRLLQLLLMEKRKVQPIYVIDVSNRSPVQELISMNEIRNKLNRKGVHTDQLKPTIYIDRSAIKIDDKISEAWRIINDRRHIGSQYIWLASLCKQFNLENIELSVQKRASKERSSESLAYNLEESRITPEEIKIFKYFSLPLIDVTKIEMQSVVKRENWSDIMESTWFCHHPVYHPFKKGVPCGVCNPCRTAIEEGFGHKIPFILRFSGKYLKKAYNSSIMNHFK